MNTAAAPKERDCGGCTLCCKLIGVDEPELNKPPNTWCTHCEKGKGCRIFGQPERPEKCGGWTCVWRTATDMPDELRPDRSKIVFAPARQGFVKAHIDPGYPDAPRRPLMKRFLEQLVAGGMTIQLIYGDSKRAVMSRDRAMLDAVQHYDTTGEWIEPPK